jgi:hypothetical protein
VLTCTAPSWDNHLLYDQVSAEREPAETARLRALEPAVHAAYAAYPLAASAASRTAPSSIVAKSDAEQGDLLRGNWGLLTRAAFRAVRWDTLAAGGGSCALCGHLDAGEVDHYLPRSYFPEFSILTTNLIPACGRCNRKKLSRHQRTGGGLAFVHPYLHGLPDEPYLSCEVTVNDAVLVTFTVTQTPTMTDELFAVLSHHFAALELGTLYRDEAVGLMDDQRNAYYAYHREQGAPGLANYLQREAVSSQSRRSYGPTVRRHWKPVLLAALAASEAFCDAGFTGLGPEFPID